MLQQQKQKKTSDDNYLLCEPRNSSIYLDLASLIKRLEYMARVSTTVNHIPISANILVGKLTNVHILFIIDLQQINIY